MPWHNLDNKLFFDMRQVLGDSEFEATAGSISSASAGAHAPDIQRMDDYEIALDFLRRLLKTDFHFSASFIVGMFRDSAEHLDHCNDGKLALPPKIKAEITELLSSYIEMSIGSLGFTIDYGERKIRSKRTLELLNLLETLCPGATASYEEERLTLQEWTQPRSILPRTRSGIRELIAKLLPR